MYRKTLCAMALAVAWSAPLAARAQDAELSKIRDEIRQMKEAYEKRIEALEKRLQDTEAKAGKAGNAPRARRRTPPSQAAVQASNRPQTESALNPGDLGDPERGLRESASRIRTLTGSTASCRRWARWARASAA